MIIDLRQGVLRELLHGFSPYKTHWFALMTSGSPQGKSGGLESLRLLCWPDDGGLKP